MLLGDTSGDGEQVKLGKLISETLNLQGDLSRMKSLPGFKDFREVGFQKHPTFQPQGETLEDYLLTSESRSGEQEAQ